MKEHEAISSDAKREFSRLLQSLMHGSVPSNAFADTEPQKLFEFEKVSPQLIPKRSDGGGSGGGNNGSSSGNGNEKGSPVNRNSAMMYIWGACALISAVTALMFVFRDTPENRSKVEIAWNGSQDKMHEYLIEREKTKQKEFDAKMAKRSPRQNQDVLPDVSVSILPTFSCGTVESMRAGFAQAEVHVLEGGHKYRFAPGCAAVRVSNQVHQLNASGYVFRFQKADGGYWGCGDTDGLNKTNDECARFLNENDARTLQLVIQNGGEVIVKTTLN